MDLESSEQRDEPSIGEAAIGSLIDQSSHMRPDEVPGAIRATAAAMGLQHASVHLIDKEQRVLLPLGDLPTTVGDDQPLDVEAGDAGRCYRESQLIAAPAADGRTQLWIPLLDGTTRIGVLGALVDEDDELVRTRGLRLAGLAAELLEAKSHYGDGIANAARRQELSLAAEIRWSLVPPLTFLSQEVRVAGGLQPAYDIAGDIFDYAVNANTAHVAIFDAVGHGVKASRMANLAVLTYRHARRRGLGLAETYAAIDEVLDAGFDVPAFATGQVATLDLPDGGLRWISAGHPYPLLVRPGQPAEELERESSYPLGIHENGPLVHELALRPGDVVAFHSDGISEARTPGGAMFGVDRLAGLLAEAITEGRHFPEIVRQVLHEVVDHQQGDVEDDATLLLVGWRG